MNRYKTVNRPVTGVYLNIKSSKFYSAVYPLPDDTTIKEYLLSCRTAYPKAGHHCYAYRLTDDRAVSNDDGEPAHSAGDSILSQIKKRELYNIIVVVSGIFGGTKLGKAGLIKAYKESASLALDHVTIVDQIVHCSFRIRLKPENQGRVYYILREFDINITTQWYSDLLELAVEIPAMYVDKVAPKLNLYIENMERIT